MEGLFYQDKLHYTRMKRRWHQRETASPRCWTWFVWSFMFSWLLRPLHVSQMLFYHRPDPMLVLKINPIFGFVANYLCLVLGYLGKFLYYQTLTGWPWENLLKNYSHIQVTVILLDGIPSQGPINNACSDSGYKFELFFYYPSSIRTKKVSAKEGKIYNYEMDLYR